MGKTLLRASDKEKDPDLRACALLALGHVLPEKASLEHLLEKAQDTELELRERKAAVLALGLGRAPEARDVLLELLGEEGLDGDLEACITSSVTVLDGGNLIGLNEFFKRVSASKQDRWRLFFWKGP